MAESATPTEAEIDAVLEEFGGDPREAIRALLQDVATLAADYESAVSRGYVRGQKARQKRAVGNSLNLACMAPEVGAVRSSECR